MLFCLCWHKFSDTYNFLELPALCDYIYMCMWPMLKATYAKMCDALFISKYYSYALTHEWPINSLKLRYFRKIWKYSNNKYRNFRKINYCYCYCYEHALTAPADCAHLFSSFDYFIFVITFAFVLLNMFYTLSTLCDDSVMNALCGTTVWFCCMSACKLN